MKLVKAEVIEILEREYIRGTKTLPMIAQDLNCTVQRLSQIGLQMIPDWKHHSRKRMVWKEKTFGLAGEANDL